MKVTPNVADLPDNYKAVVEWARISWVTSSAINLMHTLILFSASYSLASTIFQHYVANDNASESFTNMKRIHGMMPYFMLKTALKISNPMAMIRGRTSVYCINALVLKCFPLLQAFSTCSLRSHSAGGVSYKGILHLTVSYRCSIDVNYLSRMFTGSLMEEVRALQEDIEAVKVKVDDATFCEKVRLFVYAPREIQSVYKSDAGELNQCYMARELRA